MSIDLQQFHEAFFEESLEGLDVMENGLLQISGGVVPDAELINAIFRAAHSIKGGSGTFGFSEIADFTHIIETLLDEVRDGTRVLDADAIELLLKSSDCLRHMVQALQSGSAIDKSIAEPLVAAVETLLSHKPGTEPNACVETDNTDPGAAVTGWTITFLPEPQILMTGNEPARIFRELADLGQLQVIANTSKIPDFQQLTVDECFISWTIILTGAASREQVLEVFDWVIDECALTIEAITEDVSQPDSVTPASITQVTSAMAEALPATHSNDSVIEDSLPVLDSGPGNAAVAEQPRSPTTTSASSSIRVGIDKVDSLINLVGELVITQSMLSELGSNFDMSKLDKLANGLEQLLQNTRELQESVMQIRMLPISYAFNRFPRMIRDLSSKTGKKIELKLSGENTELDKTVMEQISDPLVHLVRNAADHGIELPEVRQAEGKPETGTIYLDAFHKGGNIVVEIRDDGRGINPEAVLSKARERGIVGADQVLSTQEIYELIFEPGFSTAESVSDISGRGVGMDVVRRNISSLGGRIEIESELGKGSTIRVHLPLTLAILDGQLVRVGTEVYIIPLVSIVESLQIKSELVNKVASNMVLYRLREDNVPIVPIYQEFGIEADNPELENGLLVVVEGEGQKIGLLVDDLLAQQQVVIKSLESNYRRVEGISGATILGDGSVSMILDVPGLIRRASDSRGRETVRKQFKAA
ncbi:MAG: chemotaxis protein CheA [Ketobacter sp.]|nr:MAG: chemotaxis protein CheA [Ketobacter sp.]